MKRNTENLMKPYIFHIISLTIKTCAPSLDEGEMLKTIYGDEKSLKSFSFLLRSANTKKKRFFSNVEIFPFCTLNF